MDWILEKLFLANIKGSYVYDLEKKTGLAYIENNFYFP